MNTEPQSTIALSSPIGLVAGNGSFPIEFAENAKARGLEVIAVAIRGEANAKIETLSKQCTWVHVGQLGKLVKTLARSGVKQAAFVGGVTRINFVDGFHLDWTALRMLSRMRTFNDDSMLRNIIKEIEKTGITVVAPSVLLEKSVPSLGLLTRRNLIPSEIENARIGWEAARALGNMDIGQSVIVRNKTIIAVEAVEGTDATIARAGKVRGDGGVLVKLAKSIQDLRVDLPAIGVKTIEGMSENRISALVIEAGKALIMEPQEVINLANAKGISIFAAQKPDDF